MKHPSQQGAALLSVMLVFAAASVIALAFVRNERLDIARTARFVDRMQVLHYALGAETYARQLLNNENNLSKIHGLINPKLLPIPDGKMTFEVEDLQARFNVNALLTGDKVAAERFLRLCQRLDVSESVVKPLLERIKKTPDAEATKDTDKKDAEEKKTAESSEDAPPKDPDTPPPQENAPPQAAGTPPAEGSTPPATSDNAPAPANIATPAPAPAQTPPAEEKKSDKDTKEDAPTVSVSPGEWLTDASELIDYGLPIADYRTLAPFLTALPTKSMAINVNNVSELMLSAYLQDVSQVAAIRNTVKSEGFIDSKNAAKLGVADPAIGYQSDAILVHIHIELRGQSLDMQSTMLKKKMDDKIRLITINRSLGAETAR